MHIIVLGAGVTGLTTAYYLARDGHRVTVMDRKPAVGHGASFANGGQLSYNYVAPFAGPAALRDIPGWLLHRDSPLRFRPRLDPKLWSWCLRFLAACTGVRSRSATQRLLLLSLYSRDLLNSLIETVPLSFEHSRTGKLVVYSSEDSFRAARAQMEFQKRLGCEQVAADATVCLDIEPSLSAIQDRLVGGIFTPGEQAGDCLMFCSSLEAHMRSMTIPVTFQFGRSATRLIAVDGLVLGLETDAGVLEADVYVLASGTGSPAIAASAGIHLPIYPLKGYSLTVPIQNPAVSPRVSVTDGDRKIVYAPLGDRLRIAGMADLVGWDDSIDRSRLALLVREARQAFPEASDYRHVEPWCGLRPATPTSLPILGHTPFSNLFLNVGQGALGFTLAMGSARVVADLVNAQAPAIPLDGLTLRKNFI